MDVCVVGAGSIGTLVSGLLADVTDVTLVGRADDVEAVESEGLRVTGEREATVRPTVRVDPPHAADLAIVAVKAPDTATVAEQLAGSDLGAVLSLQNGLGNEETLAECLDCPVLAGTISFGARKTAPGAVDCTGVGDVVLGPSGGGESDVADRVGALFERAAIETIVAADMPRRLWTKLAVNAGINATTALARAQNGALVDGPASGIAREATRETARVARASGVDLADEAAVQAFEDVATATAANVSSMRQDVEAGQRTEVDVINGAIVERAPKDISVPVNETLAGLIRAWERNQGLR